MYAIEQAFVDIKAFTPKGEFAPSDILPSWDYLALAQSFGAKGFRAQTVEELRAVLSQLNDIKDAPALVEIVIPQKDLAPQLKRLAETPGGNAAEPEQISPVTTEIKTRNPRNKKAGVMKISHRLFYFHLARSLRNRRIIYSKSS